MRTAPKVMDNKEFLTEAVVTAAGETVRAIVWTVIGVCIAQNIWPM